MMNQKILSSLKLTGRFYSTTSKLNAQIKNITVIGTGTMGSGIGQVCLFMKLLLD